jgi:hypothetical protein
MNNSSLIPDILRHSHRLHRTAKKLFGGSQVASRGSMLATVAKENVPAGERPLKMARLEKLRVQLDHPDAKVPTRGSEHAAGYDLSRYVIDMQLPALVPGQLSDVLPPHAAARTQWSQPEAKHASKPAYALPYPQAPMAAWRLALAWPSSIS